MKITDFFSPSKPFPDNSNKGEERPISTPAISSTQQQEQSMSLSGKSGSITIKTPRKKRERFTDPELQKLVDTVLEHREQLFGPKRANAASKAAIWDKVVKEVNKAGGMKRTEAECKKKWLDYRRKVKLIIDKWKTQPSQEDQTLPVSDILSRRQMMVAQLFKMLASDGERNETMTESSTDIGECVSTNEHILTPSYIFDSEDEFISSQNVSFASSSCLPSTSHQDEFIPKSYEKPQRARDPHDTAAEDLPIPPHTTTKPQLPLETQMTQLVAQQENIFEVLQNIEKSISASLNIQNKTFKLVKDSFLELQKTLLSRQKASNDHSSMLQHRLNSLQDKLEEMNSILQVKHFQEIMSTDEPELSASCTQDRRSTPTATYTAARTASPASKRPLDQSPSSSDFMKRTKQF